MQGFIDNFSVCEENAICKIAMFSTIGDRPEQQDSAGFELRENGGIVVVCDGMGGHEGGKFISSMATQLLLERYLAEPGMLSDANYIFNLLRQIDFHITSLKKEDGTRLRGGTTCVAVILENNMMRWISVGDSRVYLFRNGEMKQLNPDHIYQMHLDRMFQKKEISEEQYQTESRQKGEMLISFLGVGELSEIGICDPPIQLQSGDELLLASDGLYKYLPENMIVGILNNFSNTEDALHALEAKVKRANRDSTKKRDNMTLALVRMK